MPIAIEVAAFNMALAVICGALIGSERQVRQRMAGLRTNALVSLGAAGFVVFAALFPDEVSPTRVAAQVVSGIGFLGAGIIFRHGFTIHGLNTAATLWCSAAVGLMAGAGAVWFALILTGLIVFINLGLRPVVRFMKRKTKAGVPLSLEYRIVVATTNKQESKTRALILHALSAPEMHVSSIERTDEDASGQVTIEVITQVEDLDDSLMTKALAPLMVDPKVISVTWESSAEG